MCSHLVEITAFPLESKSCKGFFWKNKFSTNESTLIYNRSHDLLPDLYLNLADDNHHRDTTIKWRGLCMIIINQRFWWEGPIPTDSLSLWSYYVHFLQRSLTEVSITFQSICMEILAAEHYLATFLICMKT